jgi:hypothetical protein
MLKKLTKDRICRALDALELSHRPDTDDGREELVFVSEDSCPEFVISITVEHDTTLEVLVHHGLSFEHVPIDCLHWVVNHWNSRFRWPTASLVPLRNGYTVGGRTSIPFQAGVTNLQLIHTLALVRGISEQLCEHLLGVSRLERWSVDQALNELFSIEEL